MAGSIKIKNNIGSELSITHADNKPAKSIVGTDIAVAVDTINDFPLDASDGDTVIVRDLDRGGTFIYDSTKVAEHNDGTNFNGWIRQYDGAVNVKWFGAVGDGITDDTVAIQNAIDTRNIFIPDGTYNITNTIIVSKYGTNIVGESNNVHLTTSSDITVMKLVGTSSPAYKCNFIIKNFSILKIGDDASRGNSVGLMLERIALFELNNIRIENFNYGIEFKGALIFKAVNLYILNNNYGSMITYDSFSGMNNVSFDHCSFIGNKQAWSQDTTNEGFGHGVSFNNCNIEANSNTTSSPIMFFVLGTATSESYGVEFNNCWFESNVGSYNVEVLTTGTAHSSVIMNNNVIFGTDAGTLKMSGTNNSINTIIRDSSNYSPTTVTSLLIETSSYVIIKQSIFSSVSFVDRTKVEYYKNNRLYEGTGGLRWDNYGGGGNGSITRDQTRSNAACIEYSTNQYHSFSGTSIRPAADNTMTLGVSNLRWSEIFAANSTINTSDDREKTYIDIEEVEKEVALELKANMKKFKFNDAIEKKGDKARIHFGASAQTVKSIFEKHNLVAEDYAIFCYDEWEEEKNEDGKIIQEAGNRYGLRYSELLSFIIGAM